MQLAELDAQIEDQRHQREMEFKRQQSELDAHIELLKARGNGSADQQKPLTMLS